MNLKPPFRCKAEHLTPVLFLNPYIYEIFNFLFLQESRTSDCEKESLGGNNCTAESDTDTKKSILSSKDNKLKCSDKQQPPLTPYVF